MCGLRNSYRSLLTATEADLLSPSFAESNSRCVQCVIFQSLSCCHNVLCKLHIYNMAAFFIYLGLSQGIPREIFCGSSDAGTGFVLTKWYWNMFCRGSSCNGRDLHSFEVLLTVHLSTFILVINQLDAQNLFYNKFISCLYMFRAPCAHRQEVKMILYSI